MNQSLDIVDHAEIVQKLAVLPRGAADHRTVGREGLDASQLQLPARRTELVRRRELPEHPHGQIKPLVVKPSENP